MKTEPYIKISIIKNQQWRELANSIGLNFVIARKVYIDTFWRCIDFKDFCNIIKRGDSEFIGKIRDAASRLQLSEDDINEEYKLWQEALIEADFSDLINYRLKSLIEVGDEWLCDETKTYTFSGIQYLTKWKRYAITELYSDNCSEFSFRTKTDLPEETNYASVFSCKSIWRDGVEIWNWYDAYLSLWLEQNPDHNDKDEMIKHCNMRKHELYVQSTNS